MIQQNLQTQTSEAELHSFQNQWQQVTRQKKKPHRMLSDSG